MSPSTAMETCGIAKSLFEPSGDLVSDFSQGGEKKAEHVTRRPVFWL